MKDITYIEHCAGSFEQGLQVCIYCGKVITDYTGHWVSSDGAGLTGYQEGPVWITGVNPVETTSEMPLENYGDDDPYKRIIKKCTNR